MNIDDLRRRRATLEMLRLDLPGWNIEDSRTENVSIPVVAIDWSEIFCYVMLQPPPGEGSEELFAAHYAGLNYLLFRLRCKPVLLPPYHAEMTTFIEMLETKAIAPVRKSDVGQLAEKYDDLLTQIQVVKNNNKEFEKAILGDLSAAEHLNDETWNFVETLLKDSLPTIYLDMQQSTLMAMQALGRWLKARDESGERRMWQLQSLEVLPERSFQRSLGGRPEWHQEMDSQRPRAVRQNEADALALAYLQGLHQASFWRNIPVYFASRSLSMLQVMENHAGEFEPYRRSDGETRSAIQSSWRSWDYFAELGYYASESRSPDNDGSRRADIERDLSTRIEKLDQCISLANRGSKEPASFTGWETLRGSFDLEGMGDHQDHWKRVRARKPEVANLIDLVSSVLSAKTSHIFFEKRAALARNILSEIASILASLPHDIQPPDPSESHADDYATSSLIQIVKDNLDIPALFEEYAAGNPGGDPELIRSAVALLKSSVAPDPGLAMVSARDLLQLMAERGNVSSISPGAMDWLVGVAFFFRIFFDESLKYLPSWLETYDSAGYPALSLATRAFCAEACRSLRYRDYDQGMRFLLNVRPEELRSPTEIVVWHCLKGSLLLEWMAHAKEHYEIYPQPGGQSGEAAVLIPMLDPVAAFVKEPEDARRELRLGAANTVLMLAGRYIPENLPFLNEDEQKRKLSWLKINLFQGIQRWFREEAENEDSARYFHTLGYYSVKMSLAGPKSLAPSDPKSYWGEGVNFLEKAERLADQAGDRKTQRLVIEHLAWARDNPGVHS